MPQARKDSYKEAIDFLKKCELHKDVIAMAKKTAQGAKEAAAASVKKYLKVQKPHRLPKAVGFLCFSINDVGVKRYFTTN